MGPDIMASPALMDTIPALTTLIKPIPTASMGKLIDAITRLTVVIATAPGKSPRDLGREPINLPAGGLPESAIPR
jgi:hypothetical protein